MSLVNVIFVLSRLPCQLESLCNTRMNILTNIIEEVLDIICCQMCFLFWLQFVYFILSYIKFVTLNKIVLCFDFIDWLSDIKLSVINQRKPHHHNFWSYSRRNEKLDMSLDTMTKDNQSLQFGNSQPILSPMKENKLNVILTFLSHEEVNIPFNFFLNYWVSADQRARNQLLIMCLSVTFTIFFCCWLFSNNWYKLSYKYVSF